MVCCLSVGVRDCTALQGIKDRQLCARLHEVAANMANQEWAMKRERTKAKQRLMHAVRSTWGGWSQPEGEGEGEGEGGAEGGGGGEPIEVERTFSSSGR